MIKLSKSLGPVVAVVLLLVVVAFYYRSTKNSQPLEPIEQNKNNNIPINIVFRNLPEGKCIVSGDFKEFVYDESTLIKSPEFYLSIKLPPSLTPFDPKINERGIGFVKYPFFERVDKNTVHRFFTLTLSHRQSISNVKELIRNTVSSLKKKYLFPIDFTEEQMIITKVEDPKQVYDRFTQSSKGCIDNFLRNIDELYIVDPVNDDLYDYFGKDGIAFDPETLEGLHESPFGIYAAKYINNTPLIMNLVWGPNAGGFFNDKPYSIFDVLWSIRFDLVNI